MDLLIPIAIIAGVIAFVVASTIRIVPQARRYNIERLGRYQRTLQPGLNLIIPLVDRVNTKLDVREQVYSSEPKPVITADNLVVNIDTVLYYQITDPRAAAYEVANYLQAIDQLTVTTLRNLIGSMDLESTLTSRETINTRLREVLDEATGKWGIRVNRVEIKAIDPPNTIKEAMEKQMRAERDKRAVILHAEGERQSLVLTAEGTRNKLVLEAQGRQQAMILEADGEAKALERVFQAVHANDADPKVLAYKYLEMLPRLAEHGNGYFLIPGELTEAVKTVTSAFAAQHGVNAEVSDAGRSAESASGNRSTGAVGPVPRPRAIEAEAARAAAMAEAAAKEAKAEAGEAKERPAPARPQMRQSP